MIFKKNNKQKRIFLDYASSTPIDERVVEAMNAVGFANPSALYQEALETKEHMSVARSQVAEILDAQEKEIIFTASGTESNNLALLGVWEKYHRADFVPHVVTTVIEHSSILETCKEIERRGGAVTYVPVSDQGLVSPQDIRAALRPETVLVSVAYANNEIGTVQPIKEISKIIREWRLASAGAHGNGTSTRYPYFHVDACQAALYLPLNTLKLGVDMMTLDGIKMYGPRGVGMLYVKNDVEISPIIFGGGQERGVRSATENVVGIVGFSRALSIAEEMKVSESERLQKMRDEIIADILKTFPHATLNGSPTERLPNNINICFGARDGHPALDAEFVVISLDIAGIACSYSSSCQTLKENSSSYVVSALGKLECASSSLRITLGRGTQEGDKTVLMDALKRVIK